MKKAITINDIAAQLNLSRNTVSKALNGKYVPAKTKEKVILKAKELNYKQLNFNSSKIEKKYKILLLSGKPLNNINFFIPIIKSIENSCYELEYDLFQYIYNKDVTDFTSFHNYIKNINYDGIIAIETFEKDFITNLLKLNKPICFIDFSTLDNQIKGDYDIIEIENINPIFETIKKIYLENNFTKFCFVGDSTHCLSFQERYIGMLSALNMLGIKHDKNEDILRSDNFNYGNPEAIISEITKLKNKPECFICCNDFIARSVANALKIINVDVPKKAFIVGFDDVKDAISNHPTITSIGSNKAFLGREALRTLIYRIKNPKVPQKRITIDSNIIYRESTKKII